MRISDWSSDVCSSDLDRGRDAAAAAADAVFAGGQLDGRPGGGAARRVGRCHRPAQPLDAHITKALYAARTANSPVNIRRSEEHTSELQSLMRISYAVFCLKKKKQIQTK